MIKLIWKDTYRVDIQTIDSQHQKLFDIINQFYLGIHQKKSNTAMLEIIDELKKYSIYHFNTEEALMKQYNFIGLKRHVSEHENFKQKVNEFEEKVKSDKLVLSMAVTSFLEEWIRKHILSTDMEYSGFLTSRGVN